MGYGAVLKRNPGRAPSRFMRLLALVPITDERLSDYDCLFVLSMCYFRQSNPTRRSNRVAGERSIINDCCTKSALPHLTTFTEGTDWGLPGGCRPWTPNPVAQRSRNRIVWIERNVAIRSRMQATGGVWIHRPLSLCTGLRPASVCDRTGRSIVPGRLQCVPRRRHRQRQKPRDPGQRQKRPYADAQPKRVGEKP